MADQQAAGPSLHALDEGAMSVTLLLGHVCAGKDHDDRARSRTKRLPETSHGEAGTGATSEDVGGAMWVMMYLGESRAS